MVEASGLEPEDWEFEPPRCYWIFRHCSPIGRGGWFKPGMLRVRVSPVSFYNGPVSGLALAPAQTVTEFDSPQVLLRRSNCSFGREASCESMSTMLIEFSLWKTSRRPKSASNSSLSPKNSSTLIRQSRQDLFLHLVIVPIIQESLDGLSLIGKPAGLHACHCQEHLRSDPRQPGHDWQCKVATKL